MRQYIGQRSIPSPGDGTLTRPSWGAWPFSPSRSTLSNPNRLLVMDSTLSALVASAEQGDRTATDALFAALYDELHRLAHRELARRGVGMTLGATTLLHEAYLDISDHDRAAFPDRNRF